VVADHEGVVRVVGDEHPAQAGVAGGGGVFEHHPGLFDQYPGAATSAANARRSRSTARLTVG
jgi:hypothetical protein